MTSATLPAARSVLNSLYGSSSSICMGVMKLCTNMTAPIVRKAHRTEKEIFLFTGIAMSSFLCHDFKKSEGF